jgi:predicted RNase H-like HicB family nuclease
VQLLQHLTVWRHIRPRRTLFNLSRGCGICRIRWLTWNTASQKHRLETSIRLYQDTISGRLLQIQTLNLFRLVYAHKNTYITRKGATAMHDEILIYPTVFTEHHDEDGHYFVVTSPNIPGMVTEGTTRQQAVTEAIDAIATMLDGEKYPSVQDPGQWILKKNETIVYVPVNMTQWYREKALAQKNENRANEYYGA